MVQRNISSKKVTPLSIEEIISNQYDLKIDLTNNTFKINYLLLIMEKSYDLSVGFHSLKKIRIGSILDLSTVDWRGHTVFMVFCSGCNFRCPFCSNSPLIPMDSGREVDLSSVEERVLANRKFVDALGFTGGEPSLQPDSIMELCGWAKEEGLETFLNTNGSNPRLIEELSRRGLIDYVALDVKAPLRPEVYGSIIGLNSGVEGIVENIKEVIRFCKGADLTLETRTTIAPTLIDDEKSIREIARSVSASDLYVIQEFFPFEEVLDEKLRKLKSPEKELLLMLARSALEEGLREVYIRTRQNGMERVTS